MRLVVGKPSGTTYVNPFIQWRETWSPHPDNELLFGPPVAPFHMMAIRRERPVRPQAIP
jgi:hypothetical protein